MSDLKVQGVVEMSTEGVERALDRVGDKAGQMASRLSTEAGKAGKAVDGIGESADKGAEQFSRAEARISKSIQFATKQLELFGKTASQKFEISISDKGLDASKFEPALVKLRELEAAQARVANGGKGIGGVVQNTSYQLQDFIVQVNGGTEATKALGQQLPQMLVGFGAAGAAIGVLAALLPNLVAAFSSSVEGAKDFKEAMSDFDKAIGDVGHATKTFDMDKLYEEFNKSSGAVRSATMEQLRFQQEYIRTTQLVSEKKFGESLGGLGDYSTLDKLAGTFAGSGADKLSKQLGITLETAKDLAPVLSGLRKGTEDVGLAFNRFGTVLLGGNAKAVELAGTMATLSKAERDAAAASSSLSEAQAKMAKGHVQTKKEADEAAKARKSAAKEAEELADLLDKINGKSSGFDSSYVQNVETLLKAYDKGFAKGGLSLEQFNAAFSRYVAMQPGAVAAEKALAESVKARSALVGKLAEDEHKRFEHATKTVDSMRDEIAMLGLNKQQQAELAAAKLEASAASDLATASAIDYMRAEWEFNGVAPEIIAGYEALAEAKRASAAVTTEQAMLTRQKAAKEVAFKEAEDSAKAWEKFGDQINQSLTDSLYRAFESGKSFGEAFADSLESTFKTMVLKLAVQYTVDSTGSLVGSLANAILGTSFGSPSSGGGGTNWLGMASNANSAYNMYTGTTASMLGSGVSYVGNATGSTYLSAYGAGMSMTAAQTQAAVDIYQAAALAAQTNAAEAATLEASQALLAESASYQAAADGLGASASSASFAWPIAAAVGMYLSGQAWKSGIRANGNWSNPDDPTTWAEHPRDIEYKVLSALFGKDFAGSEFVAVTLGNSLQKFVQQEIWGERSYQYNGQRLAGGFSDEGFSGQLGTNYKQKGGIFTSTKEKTDWQDVPAQLGLALDIVYAGVKSGFVALGKRLGDNTMPEILKGFDMSFSGPVDSLFQVSADAEKQLTEAMGKMLFPAIDAIAGKADAQLGNLNEQLKYAQSRNDAAAADVLKAQIETLSKTASETWAQTFQRVVGETDAVARVIDLLGENLSDVFGKDKANTILLASDSIVKLFGSVDALSQSFSSYYSNFHSSAEQNAQAWKDMRGYFDVLGETMPTTRQGFADLVESLDLSTSAGQSAFRALMDVQSAFAALTPTLDDAAKSALSNATGATDDALAALERSIAAERTAAQAAAEAAQEQVNALQSVFDTLESSIRDLYGATADAATNGMVFIDQALAGAQTFGYMPDAGDLGNAISAVRAGIDGTVYASSLDAERDRLVLAGKLSQLQAIAEPQLTAAEQQVVAAKRQIDTLDRLLESSRDEVVAMRGVDKSTTSVVDAINKLTATMTAESQAQTAAIVSAIVANLGAGQISAATAAGQLTAAGVPTDKPSMVSTTTGSKDVFVSSGGAVVVEDSVMATNGWSGSIDGAKELITAAYGSMSPEQFRSAATGAGISAAMIDELYDLPAGTANQWALQNGLPKFANGGYYSGGLALVGEEGPELINFSRPGQVYTAPQTAALLGGGNNERLERLVEGLTAEVQRLQALVGDGNRHIRRAADAVNGAPEQPMPVEMR